ncbi:bifunctional 4-hydroxy-2-oxoglutarate aldolase/2-dehydro-3-deoxy-phosphogluconate aldolase [Leifsonia sp. SIMBA_070]|uniref:bifunctional 4-hydroxy-2-oxoglutarate aldolase/2-dehydro-3-deoxy-phosphogluconate aldolase n=1 Tax=Leifsonia sp. SIMBA_070 TaxID=3085810 RepID=UPI003979BC14
MTPFEKILPVVVLDSVAAAEPLGAALLAAGIHQVEVTLRTPAALEAIRILAAEPRLRVGAGTVLDGAQLDATVDAGAAFVVSPGLIEEVVERGRERGIPVVPGIATATELARARSLGLRTVKFFPAEPLGGPAAIAALASVFPEMSFVPTGGIGPRSAAGYLALPAVVAVGGSWMVPRPALASGDFGAVERLSREAVAAAS